MLLEPLVAQEVFVPLCFVLVPHTVAQLVDFSWHNYLGSVRVPHMVPQLVDFS